MPQPVVHFEITGDDPVLLRTFFADHFGWEYAIDSPVADEVSDQGQYGFVELMQTQDGRASEAASEVAPAAPATPSSTSQSTTSKKPCRLPNAMAAPG